MRSLPPPRKSRVRWLRKLLHKIYRVMTLDAFLHKRDSIIVKKRRTPFHLGSRKYKVKFPKNQTKNSKSLSTKGKSVVAKHIAQGISSEGNIRFRPLRRVRNRRGVIEGVIV